LLFRSPLRTPIDLEIDAVDPATERVEQHVQHQEIMHGDLIYNRMRASSIGFLKSSKGLLILHLSLIFEAFGDLRYSKRETVMQLRTGVKYHGSYLEFTVTGQTRPGTLCGVRQTE